MKKAVRRNDVTVQASVWPAAVPAVPVKSMRTMALVLELAFCR